MNIECRKVQALMSLYIDDALSYNLRMFVYNHLQKCRICMQKYLALKKTVQSLKSTFHKVGNLLQKEPLFDVIKYQNFKENISAYFDGELDNNELSDFRTYIHTKTFAREEFNSFIRVNNLIKNSIKSNVPVLEKDFSKKIVQQQKLKFYSKKFCFKEIIFSFIFMLFIGGSIYTLENNMFYKKHIKKDNQITFKSIKQNLQKINLKRLSY